MPTHGRDLARRPSIGEISGLSLTMVSQSADTQVQLSIPIGLLTAGSELMHSVSTLLSVSDDLSC